SSGLTALRVLRNQRCLPRRSYGRRCASDIRLPPYSGGDNPTLVRGGRALRGAGICLTPEGTVGQRRTHAGRRIAGRGGGARPGSDEEGGMRQVRAGIRAIGRGLAWFALGLVGLLAAAAQLLAITLACVGLIFLFPPVVERTRAVTGLARRLSATWSGVPI